MTSIETYQERISALKTSIETLKRDGGAFTIRDLDGTALVVRGKGDLCLPYGTVIAGDDTRVYLRVPHGAIIFLNGETWFKEDFDMWTSGTSSLSQLELAQSIRALDLGDAVFLYNGGVYT